MPATFLLFLGAVALASVAPVIAVALLVAGIVSLRWRKLAIRVLLSGIVGAVVVSALVFAIALASGRMNAHTWEAALLFSAGAFSAMCLVQFAYAFMTRGKEHAT